MIPGRSRDEAIARALACAAITSMDAPLAETLPPALAWTRALGSLGEDRAPLYLAHDLGWILLRGSDFRASPSPARPGDPRRAMDLAWRDEALARWSMDPSARDAHEVLAATPLGERDDAVAHALSRCVPRLLPASLDLPRGSPSLLRGAHDETLRRLDEPPDATLLSEALAQRDALRRALPDARLFSPEDLWELRHRRALPSEAARMALRALHGLIAQVPAAPPSLVRALRRGPATTLLDAEGPGAYPAGGFDAIATRGALENLVRSEAAYVGEPVEGHEGLDLFDLRLATEELLYYTRDESPLAGTLRRVTFVVDHPAELRVKQPSHPAQALVMLDAMILSAHRDLIAALGPHAVRTTLCWRSPRPEDRAVADEERALLSLALSEDLAHRRVRFAETPSPDEAVLVLSPHAPSPEIPHDAWLCARGERWSLDGVSHDPRALRAVLDPLLLAVARR